jgi:site-specific DNA-methyltransferase (adenine-specific)
MATNSLFEKHYNPDVLSCLANLSSDEVFTSPELANQVLDMLPNELWSDKNAKFLDPAVKSGVFLREIAKRLIKGLESQIPDLQERVDHIFHNQIYGIAITELTSLLSRRSVYCSKYPHSPYSVSKFDGFEGNIRYRITEHNWVNGRCKDCGASEEEYDRGKDTETHAYGFIHGNLWEEYKKVKFDVVISNPPYQLSDSGAFASASPIYHKFVEQAKKLRPRYLEMIIPSRWFAGGKGLDNFRKSMLRDNRVRVIHDYPIGEDCFPGIRISGGVCYFLWDRDNQGDCDVYTHSGNEITSHMLRPLLEKNAETFIRINEAIPILRKVQKFNEPSFSNIISARKPFGLPSDFINNPSKYGLPNVSEAPVKGGISIVGTYKYKTVCRFVDNSYPFPNGQKYIGKYKVFVSQVLDNGFDWKKERLKPFIGRPNEACTETFLCVGIFDDEVAAKNVISYMETKFFHLLMFLKKVSHHVVAKVYEFVPMQDFSKPWTDEELYAKYGLTDEEIEFIESMIRPMDLGDEDGK